MEKRNSISFLDDDEATDSVIVLNIIGPIVDAFKYKDKADLVVALSDNYIRRGMQSEIEKKKYSLSNLIHPDAIIGFGVSFSIGNVFMAGVAINALSKLGNGCSINNSNLDHDNIIDDCVHVCPGDHLAGSVQIGTNSLLCTDCSVSNNIIICRDCIIGGGALVIKDINEPGTYISLPVVRIK
ncbi:acetyltransferase [Alkalibacterium sp. 20]|uniref:acetyltransferase n=1 Tax=Alkalibacterium sp. 20 TaxID=1798803 RepID=UPI0009F80A8B|nr:acetyltransferase [Alkalibacterium sp. 20]